MYDWPLGVYVYSVNKGSAAEKAGLKKGDIIVKAGGEKVTSNEELIGQMSKYSAGDEFEITFVRDEEEKTVKVTLDEKVVEQPEEEETTKSSTKKNSKSEEKTDEQDEAEDEAEDEEEEETTTKKSKSDKSDKSDKTAKATKADKAEAEEE